MKKTLLAFACMAASATVLAQTAAAPAAPAPDYTLAFNAGLVSDYRFRGIAQTSRDPAVQGGIDFAHKSGLYLGTFASNVKWIKDFNGATKGSYEIDLYGGYKGEIAKDFTYDLGLISYRYPGNNSGDAGTPGAGLYTRADTNEFYGAVTYSMFTAKYSRSMGDFLGNPNSSGSDYIELAAGFDLGNGFTLTPHVGHQHVKNTANASYTDYALTLGKDFGNGFSASASAIGSDAKRVFYTDLNGRYIGNTTLALAVKYAF